MLALNSFKLKFSCCSDIFVSSTLAFASIQFFIETSILLNEIFDLKLSDYLDLMVCLNFLVLN